MFHCCEMPSLTLVTVLLVSSPVVFRVLRWYVVERYDPWFWGSFGLGAASVHKFIHFLLKASAAVSANLPSNIRDSLFSAIKKSNLLPSLNDSLDFDFDNYNALIEAPTVAKGAKAIGMNKLW